MTATHAITIEIGGIAIRLRVPDFDFAALLQRHYARFGSVAEPGVELALELMEAGVAADKDVRVWREGEAWRFTRGDFCAEYRVRQNRGSARLRPTPYAADSVLRILHTLLLARAGGFLLHAASVIGGRGALVFSGISGAGKTTIVRLAPPTLTRLTDEISYLRRNGAGYRAYGTPFAGELGSVGENASAAVAAIYLLVQGERDHIRDVAPAPAARAIMRNLLFFAQEEELVANLLEEVCDLVSRVPVRQLTFAPTPRVWELLQQEAS